ncbi:MAG: glutamine--fructose-6-phosphate transaminase (isomerizing) [Clostridia bacterium]|nr:glutamine--fructose-6-phosphate transaminase (isomerizing) [Clostridia bacterium]
MCGIIGYIGNKSAEIESVNLLKNLEYRGYDSAGVAVILDGEIKVTKAEGKIANLEQLIVSTGANIGIAHTRWATHGKPTEVNAHPHISDNNEWAVVHNGIIENFEMLKQEIETNSGVKFASETDTEVIPQMLEYLSTSHQSTISTFIHACNRLKGVFAIACINKNIPDTLFLAKRKSPLYVAINNDEIFVASDPICFVDKANEYYTLEDDEFCKVSLNCVEFYDINGNNIAKSTIDMKDFEQFKGKEQYPHFMLKEINETPTVLNRIMKTYRDSLGFGKITKEVMQDINKIVIVGCGTAYHAGLMGAKYIEKFVRIECNIYIASEFIYSNPIIDKRTLCIFVSQSGETADTLSAQELAKSKGALTVGLTNVLYSVLAKKVDIVLPVCAGPEIAVASTKAYTAQITILYMLARYLQNIKFNSLFDYIAQIDTLANLFTLPNLQPIQDLSKELVNQKSSFFIGKGFDYVSAEEASLKLKEITYINSSAHPAGELKHGFLALIEDGSYLFVIATDEALLDKTLNSAHEAFARGAKVVLITQLDVDTSKTNFVYKVLQQPKFDDELMPIVSIITFQLLSYYTSVAKGINPDQPRNLAKSVTVE